MAFLSATEMLRVINCRPELVAKLTQLMAAFEKQTGLRTFVPPYGGSRTTQEQAKLVADRDAQGAGYAVAPAGKSYHEFGAAFDLNIVGGGSDADYRTLASIARDLGLRPGIDFGDPYHFELPETLAQAKANWADLQKKKDSSCSAPSPLS